MSYLCCNLGHVALSRDTLFTNKSPGFVCLSVYKKVGKLLIAKSISQLTCLYQFWTRGEYLKVVGILVLVEKPRSYV